MGMEIERKFLVDADKWWSFVTIQVLPMKGVQYRQGYLTPEHTSWAATVRVRVAEDKAYLTIKGETKGLTRPEFEYPIPIEDATYMLDHLCGDAIVEKTRYKPHYQGVLWEVDVFQGANEPLIVAEVELNSETQAFAKPPWVTHDVSDRPEFTNVRLARHPYSNW